MKDNVSAFTKLYSIIIVLLPFLYQYASPLPFLSLGDFIVLIFTLYGLLKVNYTRAVKCIKPLVVFSGAFCVLTVFVSFFSGDYFEYNDALTIFLKILLYLGVCAVCTEFFDLHYVKKIYLWLVRAFSIYLLLQVIYHALSGGFLPIYLKHDWLFSWERRPADLNDYYVTGGYYRFRPSSLFLEPGYYALYVLPALFLLLFEDKKVIEPLLLYGAILLSTSGAGIVIGLIAFVVRVIAHAVYFKDGKIFLKPYAIGLFVLFVAALVYLLVVDREILPKLFNSFNARTTRSLLIFEKMDLFHQTFGLGMNNSENFVNTYQIYTVYDEGNLNFGASIVAAVVQYGVIGEMIFICSLVALVASARRSKAGLSLVLLYVVYTCFEEVIFNFRMGFLLAFAIYYIVHTRVPVRERERAESGTKAAQNVPQGAADK